MNKVLLLFIVFITLIGLVEAQEAKQIAFGAGIEGNMNTRKGAALGMSAGVDYDVFPNLAVGIKAGFSHNMARIMTLEPEVFTRWYVWELKNLSFFVQAGVGISVIFEDKEAHPAALGDLTLGVRIPFNRWFVEPSLRAGYPFIWGAGVSAGYRF
jgi:hypothetical protein